MVLPDAAAVRRARAGGGEQPRIATERITESGGPARRAATETDHPVSPAYSALVTISERLDSGGRRRLTHGERLFVTLFEELNAEWENGGLEQYLTNSSGDRAEHARAYLAEIGAWKTLALLDEAAWRFFGGVIPRAGTARRGRVDAVLTSDDTASVWLDAADRRWSLVQNELYDRLVRYATSHATDFPSGE